MATFFVIAAFVTGCAGESDRSESSSGNGEGVKASPSPSAQVTGWSSAQEAADEVKKVMLGAGVKLAQPKPKREGETVITLFEPHDKESSLDALKKGFDELSAKSWKPSDQNEGSLLRSEKGGCAAMSPTTFEIKHPDLQPNQDLISVTVVCTEG
ncbi:hypothetical protein AB0D45_31355 [Streptomyces sp. NPDC048352]|uniref:hypothetical protein n=1 Tax=Streptomyces sp. NPDC048352 TaxID=3154718 RepID=UPI003430935C